VLVSGRSSDPRTASKVVEHVVVERQRPVVVARNSPVEQIDIKPCWTRYSTKLLPEIRFRMKDRSISA